MVRGERDGGSCRLLSLGCSDFFIVFYFVLILFLKKKNDFVFY